MHEEGFSFFKLCCTKPHEQVKQGLSQEELAHKCNVDRSYISMIEFGRNEPSITKIFELCRGLKITPSYFIQTLSNKKDQNLFPQVLIFLQLRVYLFESDIIHPKNSPNESATFSTSSNSGSNPRTIAPLSVVRSMA